jgi:hypothetical protein
VMAKNCQNADIEIKEIYLAKQFDSGARDS